MTEQQPTTSEPAQTEPVTAEPVPTPAQPVGLDPKFRDAYGGVDNPAIDTGNTNPYQSIIDQQNEQIKTLMEYNAKLSGQITQMVQNGYQAQQQPQPQPVQPAKPMQYATPSLSDDQDWSLESLAKEIGKRGD